MATLKNMWREIVRRTTAVALAAGVAGFGLPIPVLAHESEMVVSSGLGLIPASQGDLTLQNAQTLSAMQPVAAALNGFMGPMDPLHQAALDLAGKGITDTFTGAAGNGLWSDARNWSNGLLPGASSNVRIGAGATVLFDAAGAVIHNLLVEGHLRFDTTKDTGLTLDTLVVAPGGEMEIGDEDRPMAADAEAKIIIRRDGRDPLNDPLDLHGGIIVLGHLMAHGADKTGSVALDAVPSVGSTSLSFSQAASGWRVGDRLILGDTQPEEFSITGISADGRAVSLSSAIRYRHTAPPGESLVVVNVSRNVVFETDKANVSDISKRGHLMFMAGGQHLMNVGVYGFGRTDKRTAVTDPLLDSNGKLISGTNNNPRGRYAVHFHQTLYGSHPQASIVKGSAVVDSPGWGFVNHSSDVVFENNVAFDVVGAAFVTEAGDEQGAFRGNVAIRSTGSIDDLTGRDCIQDFGHNGHGFWFQGADIEVVNNTAIGQNSAAFVFFTQGLKIGGKTTTMLDGRAIGSVAIRKFSGNVAYASGGGLETWFHSPSQQPTVIEGLTAWGLRLTGVRNLYTHNVILRNVRMFGDPSNSRGVAFGRNDATSDLTYDHVSVEGFATGIDLPLSGKNQVIGGTFNAKVVFRIQNAGSMYRSIQFTDVSRFGPLTQTVFSLISSTKFMDGNLNLAFATDPILLTDTIGYNGHYLAFDWQRLSAKPLSSTGTALDGMTVKQLWDTYGLAPGGLLVSDEINDPRIQGGFLTSQVTLLPSMNLTSSWATNKAAYTVMFRGDRGRSVAGPAFNLAGKENSWNILTFNYQGMKRSALVWYDTVAGTYRPNPSIPPTINPLDYARGFTKVQIGGFLVDRVGNTTTQQVVRQEVDLSKLRAQVKADGTRTWTVSFDMKDFAGNITRVSVEIVESASAVLRGPNLCHFNQPSFGKTFPARSVSQTARALLGLRSERR